MHGFSSSFEKERKRVFNMLNFLNSFDFVVVEGKKDKIALESLGIKKVKTSYEYFNSKQSFKKIAIIFDLDKGGEKLKEKTFSFSYEKNNSVCDVSFRFLSIFGCKKVEESYKRFLKMVVEWEKHI
jgi:5S rRNA maturation endonuclease (ribonuclease M5)